MSTVNYHGTEFTSVSDATNSCEHCDFSCGNTTCLVSGIYDGTAKVDCAGVIWKAVGPAIMSKAEAINHMHRFGSIAPIGSTEINGIYSNPFNPEGIYVINYVNGFTREVTNQLLPSGPYVAVPE